MFYLIIKHHLCLLGDIKDDKMVLNDAGRMIEKWYREVENKYLDIECGEFVVMPNHFHCIIEKIPYEHETFDSATHVRATLRGRPAPNNDTAKSNNDRIQTQYGPNNKKYGVSIGVSIDWFKTMTTNAYIRGVKNNGWEHFDGKLWHRNYWEHIIRNDHSYQRISEYIINNPGNWDADSLNCKDT